MPPKKRITKELILQKAFEIIHEEGIESLNARYLATAELLYNADFSVFSGYE